MRSPASSRGSAAKTSPNAVEPLVMKAISSGVAPRSLAASIRASWTLSAAPAAASMPPWSASRCRCSVTAESVAFVGSEDPE